MITVILLCWKRFVHFEDILKFWLNQKDIGQIIVWDNSGSFKTDLPVLVISGSKNLGPGIRLVASQFAKHDYVIFCDDDIKLKDGIVTDLLAYFDPNKVVGIMGKRFTGETYVSSPRVEWVVKPTEVDYLPYNLCLVHRSNCLVDIKKCPDLDKLDDWWWGREIKKMNPNISFWVIPTKNYSIYPEGGDKYAICKNSEVIKTREKYFRKWIKGENNEMGD
jgi:hypothetical protein